MLNLLKKRSKKNTAQPGQLIAENHQIITEQIIKTNNKYKSFLLAAANSTALPLTIPVNVAIQLASAGKRCLLIDLDLERNAVAKAFDLDNNFDGLKPQSFKTSIENLSVWPAHNFVKLKHMNIKSLVRSASEKFDFILINAPGLATNPDRKQIASAAQAAFVFCNNKHQPAKLAELTKICGCTLINTIRLSGQQT